MSRHLGKILFILIIAVVVFFGYKVYSSSVSQFKESSDRICKVYEEMSSSVTAIPQTAKKDSVPPDITAISNVLSSGQNQISAMLHLQHAEIEEDFSTLMLWASQGSHSGASAALKLLDLRGLPGSCQRLLCRL